MAAEARLGDDACLLLSGSLDRAAVTTLWPSLDKLRHRAQLLDLGGVTAVDSAGLALISSLASDGLTVSGSAPGLDELAAAYRLDSSLALPSPVATMP